MNRIIAHGINIRITGLISIFNWPVALVLCARANRIILARVF